MAMDTCTVCGKPLAGEKIVLTFKLIGAAFCEACSMGDKATKILAGLVDQKRVELW